MKNEEDIIIYDPFDFALDMFMICFFYNTEDCYGLRPRNDRVPGPNSVSWKNKANVKIDKMILSQ